MLASNSQHALPPLSSPQKKRSSYSQSEAQMNHPQRISLTTIGGCFECYMHILYYGARLTEERGKKEEEEREKERKKERKERKKIRISDF